MLKNFLAIAFRNLLKHKLHSLIAIVGLTLGLVAGVIIFIINYSELTWDSWWPDAENIFVVQQQRIYENNVQISTFSSPLLKTSIDEFLSDLEVSGRIVNAAVTVELTGLGSGQKTSFDDVSYQMDPSMIDILGLTAAKGGFADFYTNKQALIITEAVAKKYFGSDNPLGKILTINRRNFMPGQERSFNPNKDYTIVAVIANIPRRNSWSEHGIFVNFTEPVDVGWGMSMVQTYVKLKRGGRIERVNQSLVQLVDKYVPLNQARAVKKSSDNLTFTLLNIADLHLRSGGQQGNLERIWTLYGLAAVIVLLASINYINLSTAHNSRRQKEIALRKTLGSTKLQIIAQFMLEAVVAIAIALFLTLVVLEPIMPWLAKVLAMEIVSSYMADARLLGSILAIALLVGIVAGSYPGFYLAKIKPALILKANRSHETAGSLRLRYLLVVGQFLISIAMLIAVALIAKQIATVLNYNPGYETKRIVYLSDHSLIAADTGKISTLKHRIDQVPGVEAVARSAPRMPGASSQSWRVARANQNREDASLIDVVVNIDADEMDLLHIPIIAGRTFSPTSNVDENNTISQVILDRQALHYLGFPSAEAALGQTLDLYSSPEEKQAAVIVAVSAEVHVGDRNKPSHPVIFLLLSSAGLISDSLGIGFDEHADRRELLASVKKIWAEELGQTPSETYMEDIVKKQYTNQIMMSHFVYVFAALAMFISCLGLYGLASFTAEKRTREIGLRKVHGASVRNIVGLLLWQFTQPIVLASVIAWPVSLYIMNLWLENFNQRIDLWVWGPAYCLAAAGLAIAIAWLTVGGHALMVARAKPAEALREE